MATCPACQKANASGAGFCADCGTPLTGQGAAPSRVSVTDIDMPFGSMVGFMVKWSLASIPAVIILAVLIGIAYMLFVGLFG